MTLPAKTSQVATIRDLLERSKSQIQMALPKHLSPDRLLRVAMTSIQRTPKLLECDPKSLVGAVIQSAQLGLEPDGILGHAYLVPYRDKKNNRTLAQLIVGYKGLIDMARRSGQIVSICAHVVYEEDVFDFAYGLEETLHHVPARSNRGLPIGAYAVAQLKDGGHAIEVMWVDDIEAIRSRSKTGNTGPWKTDWSEMARKTVIRRLTKYLPLSVEVARAVAVDEQYERGLFDTACIDGIEPCRTITTCESPLKDEERKQAKVEAFKAMMAEKSPNNVTKMLLKKFISGTAKANKVTHKTVKEEAADDFESFWSAFKTWKVKETAQVLPELVKTPPQEDDVPDPPFPPDIAVDTTTGKVTEDPGNADDDQKDTDLADALAMLDSCSSVSGIDSALQSVQKTKAWKSKMEIRKPIMEHAKKRKIVMSSKD